MNGIIYIIICKRNNKVYIGQTIRNIEDRIRDHIYYSKKYKGKYKSKLYNAINKYGFHDFSYDILEDNIKNRKILDNKFHMYEAIHDLFSDVKFERKMKEE